jgi:hypothetical protein
LQNLWNQQVSERGQDKILNASDLSSIILISNNLATAMAALDHTKQSSRAGVFERVIFPVNSGL